MNKKCLALGLVLFLGTVLALGCANTRDEAKTEKPAAAMTNVQKVKLDIQGMTCSGCAFGVETALKQVQGVKRAEANFAGNSAEVEFDPSVAKVAQLVEAVNKAGFKAKASEVN